MRKTERREDTLLIICNFTPVSYDAYKVGVPYAGTYKEIFCSDVEKFGGDGSKNSSLKTSKRSACDGRKNSITIGLAPLSMSIFKLTKDVPASKKMATTSKTTKKTTTTSKTTKKKATSATTVANKTTTK